MILVLLFCGILLIALILALLLSLSTIRIVIDQLFISNVNKVDGKKLKKDFCIYLGLYLFGRIKLVNIKITDERLERISKKLKIKDKIEKLDLETLKRNFKLDKETMYMLKEIKIKISKFNLSLEIGTENVIFTSMLITFISTIVSVFLSRILEKEAIENSQYQISSIYCNKNLLKINLNCIIHVKMVHIMYIMFHLLKKGRVNKDGGTSDRRTYDYGYE